MPDLSDRLREALDAADPVTLPEIEGAARRRSRCRAVTAVVGAVVAAAIAIPLSLGSSRRATTVNVGGPSATASPPTTLLTPDSASASAGGITTTIVLDTTTVAAGGQIAGQLIVQDGTSRPVKGPLDACPDEVFDVGLSAGPYSTFAGFFDVGCRTGFRFPPGRTTTAFKILTAYGNNLGEGVVPPGHYPALLQTDGFALPIPPGITVTVTPALPGASTSTTASTLASEVTVPALDGRPAAAATAVLDRLGLHLNEEVQSSASVPGGAIVGTNPPAGSTVPVGSVITLYISGGPRRPTGAGQPTPTATTVPVATTGS